MSDATSFLKERPLVAGGIVLAVAVMAYLANRKDGGSTSSDSSGDYQFRGNSARSIDPNAAAISEAAISAGSTNLQTIASLAGLQDSNANALAASLASTSANRDVSLASTSASRDVSLAGIAASLRASLFETEAQRDESLAATGAGVTIAGLANDTQLEQARINNSFNLASLDVQRYIADKNTEAAVRAAEAQRDAERSQAKAGFWSSVIGGLEVGLGALV